MKLDKIFIALFLFGSHFCADGMEPAEIPNIPLVENNSHSVPNAYDGKSSFLELLPQEIYSELIKYDAPAINFWLLQQRMRYDFEPTFTSQYGNNLVRSTSLLTDDKRIISGDEDGLIKIWDMKTGACLKTLNGHTMSITHLLRDSKGRLISASSDRLIKIWDMQTGICINTLSPHLTTIMCMLLDGKGRLITGSGDSLIRIWNLDAGTCINTLSGHPHVISCMLLDSKGRLISGSGNIKIWDLDTDKCIKTLSVPHCFITYMILDDKSRLIAGTDDGKIRVWDLETGKCIKTLFDWKSLFNAFQFLWIGIDSKKRLITIDSGNILKKWDLETGKKVDFGSLSPYPYYITSNHLLLKDHDWLISKFPHGQIRIVDLEKKERIHTLPRITSFEFDGKSRIFAGSYGQIERWDLIDPVIEKYLFTKINYKRHLLLKAAHECYKQNQPLKLFENEDLLETYNEIPAELEEIKQTIKNTITVQETEPSVPQASNNSSNWFAALQTAADLMLSLK